MWKFLFCGFRIMDVGETEMTIPTSSTMEFMCVVWISLIVLKRKQCKGIKGYSSKHGWMVEEEPRKNSWWIFKWFYVVLDTLTVPFDIMYTTPIFIWLYKESVNSLNVEICISSCEALTRSKPNTLLVPRWFLYSWMFLLAMTQPWMLQTLLEEVSDVNGIVDAISPGFTFIEAWFASKGMHGSSKLVSRREELLCEGNYVAKW